MNIKRTMLAAPRAVSMTLLGPMERRLLRGAGEAAVRPVFIVGPPRSGTTLLYELLVTRFRCSYFSNLAHRLYRTPLAASALGRALVEGHRPRYHSRHGHVPGWGAPSEGGWIWTRWLPRDDVADGTNLGQAVGDEMRRTIAAMQIALSGPFIAKSVAHAVQLPALRRAFPRAIVIEMQRNAIPNLKSIIRYRHDAAGAQAVEPWRSVRPLGWQRYRNADLTTQACAQLRLTQCSIDDARLSGRLPHLCVSYEALCADPERELQRIATHLGEQGLNLRDRRPVPAHFERGSSDDDVIPLEIVQKLALVDAALAADRRRGVSATGRYAA